MKKSIFTLAILLSFTYTFSANQTAIKNPSINTIHNINDIVYIEEEEADEPFDFDYKSYLPENFNAYDLTDNEADGTLWIDEEEDEPFDFDHTKYLPVGFNPNKEFNALFLEDIDWIEEEEADEPFAFDTKKYFNKSREVLVTDNL